MMHSGSTTSLFLEVQRDSYVGRFLLLLKKLKKITKEKEIGCKEAQSCKFDSYLHGYDWVLVVIDFCKLSGWLARPWLMPLLVSVRKCLDLVK